MSTTTGKPSSAERQRRRASSLLLPKVAGSAFMREPCRERPRLAIYVRLSLEKDASVSVARQRETLEAYVVQLGGVYDPDTDYFEDPDVSAKGTVYRPAAEDLLARVSAGAYDGVVVWEFARFMRTVRETHIALGIMRDHAVELYSYEERHLTLYGPGRITVEFAADQAEKELLKISARVTAARAFLAKYGPAPAAAPFGTVKVAVPSPIEGRTAPLNRLVPDETPQDALGGHSPADLVRQAAREVADGASMRSVVTRWNQAGYTTAGGAEWGSSRLAQLLRNPLLAGYSVHRGQVVTDDDGRPIVFHEPVLDEATWADLVAAFERRTAHPRSGTEAPLRGLLRCGRCGGAMARSAPGPRGVYRCWRRSHGGCTGNTIVAPKTEAFVTEAALALLSDPELLARTREAGDPQAAAAQRQREADAQRLRSALERLERAWVMGEYDDGDGQRRYTKLKADLVAELDAVLDADRRARTRRKRPPLLATDGGDVAAAFDALTAAQRLTLLCELIEHVTVLPATSRVADKGSRPVYRPERLVITWHQGDL